MKRDLRRDAEAIWHAGLDAVHAGHAVEGWLAANRAELLLNDRVWVVGAGKAAVAMARPVVAALGQRCLGGLVTTKDGHAAGHHDLPFDVLFASHPVPDERSVDAAARTLELVGGLGSADLVICVLSGGASSLWTAPIAQLALAGVQARTQMLLNTGVGIEAMNTMRGSWSRIKNGGLSRAARPAGIWTLVLSDVPDEARFVGSGPTIGGDRLDVVADWKMAVAAASAAADARGYSVVHVDGFGDHGAVMARVLASMNPGTAVICGGETTLELSNPGRGGRNQHFALDVAVRLAGKAGWALMSVGTDGTDGPTDDAGGLVDGQTMRRVNASGLDANRALQRFDSGTALQAAGDLVRTGPTGTNVMDLRVLLSE